MRVTRVVVAAVALLIAAIAPPVAAAQGRSAHRRDGGPPDVRVRAVSAPVVANPGATIVASALLAGRGRPMVSFWLTRAARGQRRGARRLARALARGGMATAGGRLPATASLGRRRILACLGSSCRASALMVVRSAPATSEDLVDAALAAHRLSPDRALLYRIYAERNDPRLPARYRGDLAPLAGEGAALQAEEALPYLPNSLRKQVLPFLEPPAIGRRTPRAGHTAAVVAGGLPPLTVGHSALCREYNPIDRESWNIAMNRDYWGIGTAVTRWRTLVSPDGHVRFWYDADVPYTGAEAHQLAPYVGRIWATYKRIMGREPLSDVGAGCFWGTDGRYDVYLLPSDAQGTLEGAWTVAYPPRCSGAPAFTEVEGKIYPWALAHELFHAFQDAFPTKLAHCSEYNWIAEGSANWAAHVVFPTPHVEYTDPGFLHYAYESPPSDNSGQSAYRTWPLWLFLSERYGNQIMGSIWTHIGDADAVHAVDEAVPGGWREQWPAFTRAAYNRDPSPDFRRWDDFGETPDVTALKVALSGRQKATFDVPDSSGGVSPQLDGLTRSYAEIDLGDDVQSITLTNPHVGDPDWSMQAYLRFDDGHTEYRDLTGTDQLDLCRQQPDEDVDSVVLMMANSRFPGEKTDLSHPAPQLTARADCDHHFKVTALDATLTYQAHYPLNRYQGDTCTVTGSESYTMSYRNSGQPVDGSTNDLLGSIAAPYHLDGGTVDYSDPCAYPSAGEDPCQSSITPDDGTLSVQISHTSGAADATVGFLAYARTGEGDIACPDSFGDDWVSGDDQWVNAAVPWSELTGNQPFTITASDSPSDGLRSVSRQVSITLQPVDVDGRPLGGAGT